MTKLIYRAFALVSLIASSLAAQNVPSAQQQQQQQPKTKLEQCQTKSGSVIVMGYSTVGTLSGQFGAIVDVQTRELTDASTNTKQYGVYINVKEKVRYERENASYVDLDEIDSLIKGIDYISAIRHDATKLPKILAEYRTRGDLSIATFSTSPNEFNAVIKSGSFGSVTAYISLTELKKFKQLLQSAAGTLQGLKT